MESPFFRFQGQSLARHFKHNRLAKVITALLFLGVLLVVAIGMFFFFRSGFVFIWRDQFLRSAVSLYIYELFFLIIGILIFFNALIAGLFGLFRNENEAWIIASPRYQAVPIYVMWKVFLMSLWPLIVIVLPGLFALQSIGRLSIGGLLLMILFVILLTALAVLAAMITLVVVAIVLEGLSRLLLTKVLSTGWIIFLVVCIFFLVAVLFNGSFAPLDFGTVFQPENIQSETASLHGVVAKFGMLPTHALASSLLELQQGSYTGIPIVFGSLVVLVLIIGFIYWTLAHISYLKLWQILQEGRFAAEPTRTKGKTRPVYFPRYFNGPVGILFEKEALTTIRNAKNVLWLVFMLFIWFVQTALNVAFRHNFGRYGVDNAALPISFQAFQIIAIMYFVSAFVLRFGFPSFSTEQKTAWILGSAPMDRIKVFWAKLAFYCISFLAIGLVFGYANVAILGIPVAKAVLFITMALFAIITVSVYGLSLGALFPNYETDDPEVLSTSLPGLAFITGSLLYGALGAYLYYSNIAHGFSMALPIFGLISILAIGALLWAVTKKVPQQEFVATRE